MRPSVPDVHITDSRDAEFAEYRALASQSVIGLIFAFLAPLAIIDPALWALPVLGVFFSGWAIRRIKHDPSALTGQKLAWAGLLVSLLLAAAAPTDWFVYRKIVRDEARQVSSLWFQYLTHDQPQKAYQLAVPPKNRQPLDDNLWSFYRNTPKSRQALENYVNSPVVRTILALGPRAEVRFYETASQSPDGNNDFVEQIYAVTYEDEGEKKSFFVLLPMLRIKLAAGGAEWSIFRVSGGVKPQGW